MASPLLQNPSTAWPLPYDAAAGRRLVDAAAAHFPADREAFSSISGLIAGIGGCSPYLSRLIAAQGDAIVGVLTTPLQQSMDAACAMALCDDEPGQGASGGENDLDDAMVRLRRAKALAALTAALGEISGAWSVLEAAKAFSGFADAALSGAMRAALRAAEADGFSPADPSDPEVACGVAILAMGKLGGGEVNYSSDIDVIVLYDPDAPALAGNARAIALNVAKRLVKIMAAQTRDGYVFRTDLRLRPDPGASTAAVSVAAAEAYYEAHGQNWERAAFIRARAAAGDRSLGEAFLKTLRPFVWRKYLDFAALEDIHSIKRQVHASKGGASIEFAGHDLKTGAGGIREIEFFAQTQQLILGGKNPALRSPNTPEALASLLASGAVAADQHDDLIGAYQFLRRTEHRLQMINDQQTHAIPANAEGVERLSAFLGYQHVRDFEADTRRTLACVHDHFADLFNEEERLSAMDGSLSFTGVDHDPRTLASLREMGFERPETVSDTVRRWHAGGLRATRTTKARELLTRITPRLLESLSKSASPDEAFIALDAFLSKLPSGVQIFSLFANSPEIFDRLTRIVTVAPALARRLAQRRHLVEAVLEASWRRSAGEKTEAPFRHLIIKEVAGAPDFETALNAARRLANDEKFLIASRLVLGDIDAPAAAAAFTDIADAVITAIAPAARAEMERRHGAIDGELAILALGRLGARQMTAVSDIDLIFVYDAPDTGSGGTVSNGDKPLTASVYFTRLVRRLVTALTAPTQEGALYDVDMQLRPSGGAGPAAVSKTAFEAYFEKDAWTWEVMALTKARIVTTLGCGRHARADAAAPAPGGGLEDALAARVNAIIACSRDDTALVRAVHDMRLRLAASKQPLSVWDLKNADGGLTDLEFILQYFHLRRGALADPVHGGDPAGDPVADPVGRAVGADLPPEDVALLRRAWRLYQTVMQIARAAIGGVFEPAGAGLALSDVMSQACSCSDVIEVERKIVETETLVAALYGRVVRQRAEQ